jgi:hypothetical protein
MGLKLGCLTLREEHRPKVSEDRVQRRIFGLQRDEVMGGYRKLHSVELYNKKQVKLYHCTPMESQRGRGCIEPTHSRPLH